MKHVRKSLITTILIATVLVLAVAIPVIVTPALASTGLRAPAPQEAPAAVDLSTFLKWLASSGGSIIAVSWLLERSAWFQVKTSEAKDNIIFGAAVVVSCGSYAVVTYVPAAILAAIAPYFLLISGSFVTVYIAKAFHREDRK